MRVRWEDVGLRIYVDGAEAGVFASVNISWDENIEVDEAKYQGMSTPSLDGHYRGAKGSIEFRLDDAFGDPSDIVETQKRHLKDRTPGGRVRIVATHRKPGGSTIEGRRFDNCILSPGTRVSENNPLVPTWGFQAENCERIQ